MNDLLRCACSWYNYLYDNTNSKNQDDYNFYLIQETNHTFQYNNETTGIDNGNNRELMINSQRIHRADSNELIIIDYPYEYKKPKLLNLFNEKPEKPLNYDLFNPININIKSKHKKDRDNNNDASIKDQSNLTNDNNELNNTLNEGYVREGNWNGNVNNGSANISNEHSSNDILEPINIKTDHNYLIGRKSDNKDKGDLLFISKTNTTTQPKSKSLSKNPSNNNASSMKQIKHCNTHKPKLSNQKQKRQKEQLKSRPNPMMNIDNENNNPYCLYCEEIYKNCIENNTPIPPNKTCINCNKAISNEALDLYKNNSTIEQYGQLPKSTRNNNKTNQSYSGSIAKSLTIAQAKKSAFRIYKLDSSKTNSNNSSFIKEKKLFQKKYSFLKINNKSTNSIKNKDKDKEREKEKEQTLSKASTVRENYAIGSANRLQKSRHYHPLKLTISFGDENKK